MNTEQVSLQELTEGFLQSAMALLYSLKSGDYRCPDKYIIDRMEKDPEYLPKYAIALSERVIIAMVNSGHFESPEDTKRHFVKLMLFNEMIQWGKLTEEEDNERWELYNKIVNAMAADSEFVEFIYGKDA